MSNEPNIDETPGPWDKDKVAAMAQAVSNDFRDHGYDTFIAFMPSESESNDGGSVFYNKRPWPHLASFVAQCMVAWGSWLERESKKQSEDRAKEETQVA